MIANWDLDGQASASMLIRSGYAEDVFFPSVGYYWLEDIWIDSLSQYDTIYIVDMYIPRRDVEKLTNTSYIFIIDDSNIHPNYEKLDVSCICGKVFSTTYTLMDYLGIEPDIDAILGMYNDSGDKIINSEYWDIFSKYLEQMDLTLKDLDILKNYFNSPYYINDLPSLYRNVKLLLDRRYRFSDLPGLKDRLSIIGRKDKYIRELMERVEDLGNKIYLEYYGEMYVISELATKLSKTYSDKGVIVVDRGFIPGYSSIAIISNIDLENHVKYFLENGYPAGGEGKFLGVVVSNDELDVIYEYIDNYII